MTLAANSSPSDQRWGVAHRMARARRGEMGAGGTRSFRRMAGVGTTLALFALALIVLPRLLSGGLGRTGAVDGRVEHSLDESATENAATTPSRAGESAHPPAFPAHCWPCSLEEHVQVPRCPRGRPSHDRGSVSSIEMDTAGHHHVD